MGAKMPINYVVKFSNLFINSIGENGYAWYNLHTNFVKRGIL